jgi:hypothetical protein
MESLDSLGWVQSFPLHHSTPAWVSAKHPAGYFDLSPALPKWEGGLLREGGDNFPAEEWLGQVIGKTGKIFDGGQ